MAEDQRRTNEKPIKLPDDFDQTLRDLLATGPTPKGQVQDDEPDTDSRRPQSR